MTGSSAHDVPCTASTSRAFLGPATTSVAWRATRPWTWPNESAPPATASRRATACATRCRSRPRRTYSPPPRTLFADYVRCGISQRPARSLGTRHTRVAAPSTRLRSLDFVMLCASISEPTGNPPWRGEVLNWPPSSGRRCRMATGRRRQRSSPAHAAPRGPAGGSTGRWCGGGRGRRRGRGRASLRVSAPAPGPLDQALCSKTQDVRVRAGGGKLPRSRGARPPRGSVNAYFTTLAPRRSGVGKANLGTLQALGVQGPPIQVRQAVNGCGRYGGGVGTRRGLPLCRQFTAVTLI
ncbi:hypothetical protein STEPF1_01979 [Streptomyces sp. F-1]|nr:hypothetical protein STEPF1_01979 [Streptomyces sp. F-1]